MGWSSSMDDLDRLLDEAERVCSIAPTEKKAAAKVEDSTNDDVSR